MASRALDLAKMFEDKANALKVSDQRIAQGLANSRGRSLSTANLVAAGIDQSTNPLLQTIWEEVELFNERGLSTASRNAADDYQLSVQLDGIYYWSMQYATSKMGFRTSPAG